jgi:hypothetical protein
MKIIVPFVNPNTGERRLVKLGWSWTLFFFAGALGIPLFYRRLWVWGAALLTFWIAQEVAVFVVQNGPLTALVWTISVGLAIFLGMKGNEITAKQYLEDGWQFAEPDSDATRYAKMNWDLAPAPQLGGFVERRDPRF